MGRKTLTPHGRGCGWRRSPAPAGETSHSKLEQTGDGDEARIHGTGGQPGALERENSEHLWNLACQPQRSWPPRAFPSGAAPHATLYRTSPPTGTSGHSSSETVRRPRDTSPKIHRYVAPVSASTRSKRVPTLG